MLKITKLHQEKKGKWNTMEILNQTKHQSFSVNYKWKIDVEPSFCFKQIFLTFNY